MGHIHLIGVLEQLWGLLVPRHYGGVYREPHRIEATSIYVNPTMIGKAVPQVACHRLPNTGGFKCSQSRRKEERCRPGERWSVNDRYSSDMGETYIRCWGKIDSRSRKLRFAWFRSKASSRNGCTERYAIDRESERVRKVWSRHWAGWYACDSKRHISILSF